MRTLAICIAIISVACMSCGDADERKRASFDSVQREYNNPWDQTQAELIVGRPVRFSEAGASSNSMWYSHTTKFVALETDSLGQLSMLEFNFLGYIELDSAKRSYVLNKEYYLKDGRVEELVGIGDEAFFHTDDKHFFFAFVRKGNRELRVRLDFISDLNTQENFLKAVKEIADTM